MSIRPLAVLALALAALSACDVPVDAAADADLRAIVVTDKWGIHDPAHAPDVNSCDDYWNDRCAGLGADQCQLLRARYSCSSADIGVVVTDRFGDLEQTDAAHWRVFAPGLPGFSAPASTPQAACGLLPRKLRPACKPLAAVAAVTPQLRDLAPNGGLAPVLSLEELEQYHEPPYPIFQDDLLFTSLPEDWHAPALPHSALELLAGSIVIEDDIMLLAAPDGTTVVSSKDIILIRDVRCTMDKVEVCVDVDVK